jgi:two-component system, chemotaxis family, protein-glutamate methylesterase/glutaminase
MVNEPKFIVVVGASAGGLNAVIELAAQLTLEMDMAVFVVLHLSHLSASELLVARLQKNSAFTCKTAEHGEPIQSRHLYFAVPDKHLLLKEGKVLLGEGAMENRWRPSIDVLFRSAAAAYDGRTIGIVLSGLMQDGTAGMQAIQLCGGTTIVQDPGEAEYPDMPLSVMEAIKVDYSVPLSRMGDILLEKSQHIGIPKQLEIPPEIAKEAKIVERVTINIDDLKKLGEKSLYSCPECGGGLWEIQEGNVIRYRCHTGHAYTQDELVIRQSEALEGTLWIALRMLEERKNLLEKMAAEEKAKGWERAATLRRTRAAELYSHIERLKEILFQTKQSNLPATG